MKLITSLKEQFDENNLSIDEFKNNFSNATLAMMGEAGNVSVETMKTVKRALSSFYELIDHCEVVIYNEENAETCNKDDEAQEKNVSGINEVECLGKLPNSFSSMISEVETTCEKIPCFILEDFRKAANKAESELFMLKGKIEAYNNRQSRN